MTKKLNPNHIKVIGVGNEGKEVVSYLIDRYLFSEVKYIVFEKLIDKPEFHINFPGEKKYLYGEKHEIHVIENYNKDALFLFFSQLDSSTIINFCLSEPISHVILDIIFASNLMLFVRIPFKFEYSNNYAQTKVWVSKLKTRNNTILLDSHAFSLSVKPLPFDRLYLSMINGQANKIASLLKLFPIDIDASLVPFNYLYRTRVTYIFNEDNINFSEDELVIKLQFYLNKIQQNQFDKIIIDVNTEDWGSFHFVDKVSTKDLILIFMILSVYSEKINLDEVHFWGKNSHELLKVFKGIDNGDPFPENYLVLQKGFAYFQDYLSQNDNYTSLFTNINKLANQYKVELRKHYIKKEVSSSLIIVNS